ncbi:MAG: SpoIIE family protein phosphatase [Gemmatimonadetes bacterium]|nr:SpoIIE family protein phosphatase [Gemmatimonadota bacterium]
MRLWRYARGRLRPVAGCEGAAAPAVKLGPKGVERQSGEARWVAPLAGLDGYWYEIVAPPQKAAAAAERLVPVLSQLLAAEVDTLRLAEDLQDRLEEIELLYSISEVLGRTIRLEEATQKIVREVSSVVGARRSSILVCDESGRLLRPVAGHGIDVARLPSVPVDDPGSIAARVFRERRMIGYDPNDPEWSTPGRGLDPTYRGSAFLSAPILYPTPEGPPRPVGVLNLTDRIGADAFTAGERRLVAAIATQIGAAVENARLIERDREQQRVRRELELAHDLQLRLLPRPAALGLGAAIGARCEPAQSVGGDFYDFLRLPGGAVGVMLGDVSSHGFGAALIMALVLSAAGIHAVSALSPEDALHRLLNSVAAELSRTEMHLALFYGVVDPVRGRLRYSNAGHPHAFRLAPDGTVQRLGATSPPLGLVSGGAISGAEVAWQSEGDLLVLVSDGIIDARDAADEPFGEERVFALVRQHRGEAPQAMVDAVFAAVPADSPQAADDRTLLILRI